MMTDPPPAYSGSAANAAPARRRNLWIALSDLYLDQELEATDHRHITGIIRESGFTLREARIIDRDEVFPVLYGNLLSVAGVWSGFDEDSLQKEITDYLNRRKIWHRLWYRGLNTWLFRMRRADWRAIEAAW